MSTPARPAAPTSGGAVRFCWRSDDQWGRTRTLSIKARNCPDPSKVREMIADLTDCETWVEAAT